MSQYLYAQYSIAFGVPKHAGAAQEAGAPWEEGGLEC